MRLVAKGAEASLYDTGTRIVKRRLPKRYRLPVLDEQLRKARTRREARVFAELEKQGISVPHLYSSSDRTMRLSMDKVEGKQLRDVLAAGNASVLMEKMGRYVRRMHAAGIIHGDVTTSNVMVNGENMYLIDFGLSFFSNKAEDRAVDIHVLKETLKARHAGIGEKSFEAFFSGYMEGNPTGKDVLQRLELVEARGRYKGKGK